MKLHTAIILAGGLGTRLQSAVPNLPKCMAPINGRPFLDYVLHHLSKQGITHFIFALGYKSSQILNYLNEKNVPNIRFSIEEIPLGTGGAIKKAMPLCDEPNVLVVNGDTLFTLPIAPALDLHLQMNAECTIGLQKMSHFDRYGTVWIDHQNRIMAFHEKQPTAEGLINGGTYIVNIKKWVQKNWPEKFSFETDYLQKHFATSTIIGAVSNGYFIDIGVPEDYERAQTELAHFLKS